MSSLRPVSGTAEEVLALLRSWNSADDEPAPLVVQTSGSTGEPKGVLLSRAALRASATGTAARLGGHGEWLMNLPATFVAGLQVLFRSVLADSDPVMQTGSFVEAARRMTGDRRFVSVVPTQLHRLLADDGSTDALRAFAAVLVGGAAVPTPLRERAAASGVHVVATYGMSETCGGCVYDGVPLDGVAVAVDAEPSTGSGEAGRIRIAGPVLFDGYDERADVSEAALVDGWFLTNDLGRLDDDGRLEVLGRIDDVILSGGVNVPAAAVAARLGEHAAVSAAEVVGVDDEEWGARVVAFVVGDLDLDAAREWVAAVHPRSWAPRDLRRVTAIPLLHNGKVDRLTLREWAT